MNDLDLLSRIAAGSRGAFESFYQLYERRLYGYLLGLVREPANAEELVVDVMHEVWRNAGRFQGRSRVSTWLFGIARNKALMSIRGQRSRASTIVDDADPPELVSDEPDATHVVQRTQEAAEIRRALNELSPDHCRVLELAFYEERSYREISDLLGIPVNTVKTRVYYGKQQLKSTLKRIRNERH